MSNFAISRCDLDGVLIIEPRRFDDERGFFMETYSQAALAEHGFTRPFVQDNQSLSISPGTLRGLHYQRPPFAQDKLVRVVRGRIWDVVVDIRRNSPTRGRWFGLELSGEARTQILIPVGFAHGFVTLQPDTEVIYKVTAPYSAAHDTGIAWDDPDLAVDWRLPGPPVLSDKDRRLPRLAQAQLFD